MRNASGLLRYDQQPFADAHRGCVAPYALHMQSVCGIHWWHQGSIDLSLTADAVALCSDWSADSMRCAVGRGVEVMAAAAAAASWAGGAGHLGVPLAKPLSPPFRYRRLVIS